MKLLYCLFFMSALLCEGKASTTTTTKATTSHLTTNASPKNLTGKMMTLSMYSSVIFNPNQDNMAPGESTGVSVCLRVCLSEDPSNVLLFKLMYDTPVFFYRMEDYKYSMIFNRSEVPLEAYTSTWFSLTDFIWAKVCMVLDTQNNVVQFFRDTNMSIRKILPFKIVLSGVPQLRMSGFDGQVTDLQVWDHPLQYSEVSRYMKYGGGGTLLTWCNIVFNSSGSVLVEDSYPKSSEGEEWPIMGEPGWDQRLKYKRMLPGMEKKRKMF